MDRINEFRGRWRFLSNFFPASVALDGAEYPTVEHAYQAAKSADPAERQRIRSAEAPGTAKRLGQRLTMRQDWCELKLQVMEDLVTQKFTRHPALRSLLLGTGAAELCEGRAWGDAFWGVDQSTGQGANHLGKILMRVRHALAEADSLFDRRQHE